MQRREKCVKGFKNLAKKTDGTEQKAIYTQALTNRKRSRNISGSVQDSPVCGNDANLLPGDGCAALCNQMTC